jgi:pimeloyl-ACP methyl ester carboxylesterase
MELKVDGKRVYAATGGKPFDPKQPTVVFIHGAGGDHTVWALQTRWFAWHGRSVLAIDLPGHGRSDGPALAGVAEAAAWVPRLLDAAGLEKAALIGHSMGALISLATAAAVPERVWSLCLVGASYPMGVNPELLAAAKANDHLAIDLVNSWGHGRRAHLGGAAVPGLWMLGGGVRLQERAGPGVLHADMNACDSYKSGEADAGKVRCPTTVIAGDRDLMTPVRNARALSQKIQGAELVVLKNCGHMMMAEAPDALLDALIEAV